jgi:flavin-dependent dehydrogenase
MKPMSCQQIYDLIFIGGGPSSLFTSNLLAQDGISTVLIEKESERVLAVGEAAGLVKTTTDGGI